MPQLKPKQCKQFRCGSNFGVEARTGWRIAKKTSEHEIKLQNSHRWLLLRYVRSSHRETQILRPSHRKEIFYFRSRNIHTQSHSRCVYPHSHVAACACVRVYYIIYTHRNGSEIVDRPNGIETLYLAPRNLYRNHACCMRWNFSLLLLFSLSLPRSAHHRYAIRIYDYHIR